MGEFKIQIPERISDAPKDLPAITQDQAKVPKEIRAPVQAVTEAVQTLLGFRGNPLDRSITYREAQNLGLVVGDQLNPSIGSGEPGPPGPVGPPGTAVTPDLTPPPDVTGLAAVAGFSNVIVSYDNPTYTVGHGHQKTNIYAVKKASTDATLPVFTDAVLVDEATGGLTLVALPSDLSIRWHIWAKYETNDGVESIDPAGGVHGVVAQTGLINGVDLAPLIITADKLSAGTYPGVNLVPNAGAEDGTVSWALAEGAGGTFIADTSDKISGSQSFKVTKALTSDFSSYACSCFPVIPGETYGVKVQIRTNTASAAGLWIEILERATKPTGGFINAGNRDSVTGVMGNAPSNTAWTYYEYQYIAPPGVYWASLAIVLTNVSTATQIWWDDCSVGRQITAAFLAAGSIAVGSAAIANGAIRNALIANAAIDDAKIANLSAVKLTIGDGTVGGNLKSTTFVSGTSGWIVRPDGSAEFSFAHIRGLLQAGQVAAGYITATMIDSRGLTIKDSSGTVIFGSGQNLDWDRVSNAIYFNKTSGMTITGNTAEATSYPSSNSWFEQVNSNQSYPNGAQVSWVVPVGAKDVMFGLNTDPSAPSGGSSYTTLDYAFYTASGVNGSGYSLVIYESGAGVGIGGGGDVYHPGDFFTIAYDGSNVTYYHNGGLVRKVAAPPNLAFYADSRFGNLGGKISKIQFGPYGNPSAVSPNNQITSSNASTYIANAAIGSALIGVLTAGNLTVGVLSNTINGSITSGQRVEVATNVIRVYDSSNVLRVKLGDLS